MVSVNVNYLLFLRDIHESNLALKDADREQGKFVNKLKGIVKGRKPVEKS